MTNTEPQIDLRPAAVTGEPINREARAEPLVIIMGAPSAETTTVALTLASKLGLPFVSGDHLHSRANLDKIASEVAITDPGHSPCLRAIADWLRAHRSTGGVLACSPLERQNRAQLMCAPRVQFVHLLGFDDLIRRRMPAREYIAPPELLRSQLSDIEPLGLDEPGYSIVATNATPDAIATTIVDRLRHDSLAPPPLSLLTLQGDVAPVASERPLPSFLPHAVDVQHSIRDRQCAAVPNRSVLFEAHSSFGHCGVIESGLVKCSKQNAGARDIVWLIGPGELVGEHRLLGRPANYTATALGELVLKSVQRGSWSDPQPVEDWVLAALVRRVDEAIQQPRHWSETVQLRLKALLRLLSQQLGRRVDGTICCSHGLTQGEMASIVGTERVTVNRTLAAFARARWMTSEHGAFTILDESGLEWPTSNHPIDSHFNVTESKRTACPCSSCV